MSTSHPTSIDSQYAIFTLTKNKSRSSSSNINSLYEIEYVPGDQLSKTTFPLSYQQACIGTVQTTLNAGTVFITLFTNFNVSLQDPNLLKTLKVQLQLIGAHMQEKSVVATLYHQIIYRIQDHALDLVLPSTDEALKSHPSPKHPTQYTSLDRYLMKNYCADYQNHE
ncbi:hypothetical protein Bca4012_064151 [Brassica carinata]